MLLYLSIPLVAISHFKQAFGWGVFTRYTSFQTPSSLRLTCVLSFRRNLAEECRLSRKRKEEDCAGRVLCLLREQTDVPPAQVVRGPIPSRAEVLYFSYGRPRYAPCHLVNAGVVCIARRRLGRGNPVIQDIPLLVALCFSISFSSCDRQHDMMLPNFTFSAIASGLLASRCVYALWRGRRHTNVLSYYYFPTRT
ncbi:hypothetical protein EDB86DRAFT_2915127 [Lactarius hatsudake]|nr:hypothetical protein EDB86DRAFT_2915127 [Lactarius hatsudake]